MFRLFLIDRLISAHQIDKTDEKRRNTLPARRLRNRRIYERYSIDSKHLALMNDQDILLIRDISESGFSTEVSTRGFQRLLVGDEYRCRIRYLSEIYDLNARVTWKAKQFVGFEISKQDERVQTFLERLILPLEIGSSLEKVEIGAEKTEEKTTNREWFQGSKETNLFLWHTDKGEIRAWQLENESHYVEWNQEKGLQTGNISVSDKVIGTQQPWEKTRNMNEKVDPQLRQYATDVFMAFQKDAKTEILDTLME